MSFRVLNSVRSLHNSDGAIVLDVVRGRLFMLDRVASRILQLLESGCSTEKALIGAIEKDFAMVPENAGCDIREFLDALCAEGLIVADQSAAELNPR